MADTVTIKGLNGSGLDVLWDICKSRFMDKSSEGAAISSSLALLDSKVDGLTLSVAYVSGRVSALEGVVTGDMRGMSWTVGETAYHVLGYQDSNPAAEQSLPTLYSKELKVDSLSIGTFLSTDSTSYSVMHAKDLTVNGSSVGKFLTMQSEAFTSIYAPTSLGTAGQVLITAPSGSVVAWTDQSNLSAGSAKSLTEQTLAAGTDLNTVLDCGKYHSVGSGTYTNIPVSTNRFSLEVLGNYGGQYKIQRFIYGNTAGTWVRAMYQSGSSAVWTGWKQVWDSGNSNLQTVDWAAKALTAVSVSASRGVSAGGILDITSGTVSGVTDYDQLTGRPKINSVTLTGNVSLATLGVASVASLTTHASNTSIHVEQEGWNSISGYPHLFYRRIGKMICFKGYFTATSTTQQGGANLFTFSVGYRPAQEVAYTQPYYTNQAAIVNMRITTDGKFYFQVYNLMSYGAYSGSATVYMDGLCFFTD